MKVIRTDRPGYEHNKRAHIHNQDRIRWPIANIQYYHRNQAYQFQGNHKLKRT